MLGHSKAGLHSVQHNEGSLQSTFKKIITVI